MGVKPWVVDDELWTTIEPMLPPWPERLPGPKPVLDRLCLQGILFVLNTGIPWKQLPVELGFGFGQTWWRRLERWQEAGVFDQLHRTLLAELNAVGKLDWSRACVDASHVRAKKVPLWFSSSCSGCGWLVEGAVAEHGEEDVDAASGECDEGGDVVFALAAFAVVVGA